jgi:hypothetical protein
MPNPNPHHFMPVMYPVAVSFDKDATPQFTFDGMDKGNSLTVKTGMATIVLQLKPAPGQILVFTESPITWFGAQPPACMSVRRDSDTQATIVNFNTNMEKQEITFGFELSVWCDGVGYLSQDPTILNAEVPPTSGPDGVAADGPLEVRREKALRAV